VLAAWIENGKNHQIGVRKEPFLGFRTRGFRDPRDLPQMPVLRQTAEMFQANTGEAHDLVLGEELLARLDSDHTRLEQASTLHAE